MPDGSIRQRYVDLARAVIAAPARLDSVRMVAVDGPAGSGKTSFAARLAESLRALDQTVAVIHTDDLLDGWADLVSFWPRLEEWVLNPLRRGEPARYRRYDWDRGRFLDGWIEVSPPNILIVEGVTTARATARAYLSLSVFVTADPALRLARGIDRDGPALLPQWRIWMEQEQRHFDADQTPTHVDVVVDGAPTMDHDMETEFVRLRS